jgi:hypothetical protein
MKILEFNAGGNSFTVEVAACESGHAEYPHLYSVGRRVAMGILRSV